MLQLSVFHLINCAMVHKMNIYRKRSSNLQLFFIENAS